MSGCRVAAGRPWIGLLASASMAALALQLPAQPPSVPVARIVVTGPRTVVAGDSIRLSAQPVDSAGRAVQGAQVRFSMDGGIFEGSVDPMGLVRAGIQGTIPVRVSATVPGRPPVSERLDVLVVPGPASAIVLTPRPSAMVVGERLQFSTRVLSALGQERRGDPVVWESSAPKVLHVDAGVATALRAGSARVTATTGSARSTIEVQVLARTVTSVRIAPPPAGARQGDVLHLSATAFDGGGTSVEGLATEWSITPADGTIDGDGTFVGYRAATYLVTARMGTRAASLAVRLAPRGVEREAVVVGRVTRSGFPSSEVWVHPGGRYAYLGTQLGGDRLYAIDIADPSHPIVTDSLVVDARGINDLMATADGKWLVYTREGAADRKNGIGIASLADPAHPKVVANLTDGVSGGVHSAFVNTQPKFGTHVYLTNDGTRTLDVIDINDPQQPRAVGHWRTSTEAGRYLHDVDVQDGLAYLSYMNDGLVILDVGNGVKGGSPSVPMLVTQFTYSLDSLYGEAIKTWGTGFLRGTHTAWRHGRYVFVGDEVLPPPSPTGLDLSVLRPYGVLQVVDVSDIEHPKAVAWYEPPDGGMHNIWVAGDTLYFGAYNAGFKAFDISGELRGDLRQQGREIAAFKPMAPDGFVHDKPMTWGVVVKDGLAYVADMNSGLWIMRLGKAKAPPTVP